MVDNQFNIGNNLIAISLLFDLSLMDIFVVQLAVAHISVYYMLHFSCFNGSTEILIL